MLPEQLEKILQQVQANAHYMPDWQLEVGWDDLGDSCFTAELVYATGRYAQRTWPRLGRVIRRV